MIPLPLVVLVSAALFAVGLAGLLMRRNALVMLMCLEMLINAANINLLAFSRYYGPAAGQGMVFFVIAVEAAELAAALAVVTAYHRWRHHVSTDGAVELKEGGDRDRG